MATTFTPLSLLHGDTMAIGLPASPANLKAELQQLIARANAIVLALNDAEDLGATNSAQISSFSDRVRSLEDIIGDLPLSALENAASGLWSYSSGSAEFGVQSPLIRSIEEFAYDVILVCSVEASGAQMYLPAQADGIPNGQIRVLYTPTTQEYDLEIDHPTGDNVSLGAGGFAICHKSGTLGQTTGSWRLLFHMTPEVPQGGP